MVYTSHQDGKFGDDLLLLYWHWNSGRFRCLPCLTGFSDSSNEQIGGFIQQTIGIWAINKGYGCVWTWHHTSQWHFAFGKKNTGDTGQVPTLFSDPNRSGTLFFAEVEIRNSWTNGDAVKMSKAVTRWLSTLCFFSTSPAALETHQRALNFTKAKVSPEKILPQDTVVDVKISPMKNANKFSALTHPNGSYLYRHLVSEHQPLSGG